MIYEKLKECLTKVCNSFSEKNNVEVQFSEMAFDYDPITVEVAFKMAKYGTSTYYYKNEHISIANEDKWEDDINNILCDLYGVVCGSDLKFKVETNDNKEKNENWSNVDELTGYIEKICDDYSHLFNVNADYYITNVKSINDDTKRVEVEFRMSSDEVKKPVYLLWEYDAADKSTWGVLNQLDYLHGELNDMVEESKVSRIHDITDELAELYETKNHDYGNSFEDTLYKYGLIVGLGRLHDKFSRAESLILYSNDQKVKDEALVDTLKDLALYALIMAVVYEDAKKSGSILGCKS